MEKIKDCVAVIKKKMDEVEKTLSEHKTEINKLVIELKHEVINEMNRIMQHIGNVCEQLEQFRERLDFMERDRVASDMLISGIPVIEDLSAEVIFSKICNVVGFDDTHTTKGLFRPNLKSVSNNNKSRSIIVRFINMKVKSNFFSKYKHFKSLKLSDIGINLETRIYCNDLLTRNNAVIFRTTRELQKIKIITKTFTRRGMVYIIDNNNKMILVRNPNDLDVYKNKNISRITNTNANIGNDTESTTSETTVDDVILNKTTENGREESTPIPIASRIRSKTGSVSTENR